jgi:hypothetical protein
MAIQVEMTARFDFRLAFFLWLVCAKPFSDSEIAGIASQSAFLLRSRFSIESRLAGNRFKSNLRGQRPQPHCRVPYEICAGIQLLPPQFTFGPKAGRKL